MSTQERDLQKLKEYKYGFVDPATHVFKSGKGFTREVVEEITHMKGEPEWMRKFRLKAYEHAIKRPTPTWGGDLSGLNLDEIYFYIRPSEKTEGNWDDVPDTIKRTFDKLGIPEAERKFLAGVGAQYECLSGGTRVYTGRGLTPIRDIRAGDTVFALDETTNTIRPAPVNAIQPKGERPVFEVKVGTRTIRATENHPFLTLAYQREPGRQRGRYVRAWKYLCDLKAGDLVAVAKMLPDVGQPHTLEQPRIKTEVVGRNQSVEYRLDISGRYTDVSLPQQTSDELMWWLGLYMGDGFIHSQSDADKARVEFAIPATDGSLRTEFKQATSRLFDLGAKNGDPYRLSVNSTIVARYLEVNGFSGGALEKRVPAWVASLPQSQILAFLGGYVDADGYVRDHRSNHDMVLTSGNLELLQDVRNLAAQCGLPASHIHRFESKHPHDKARTIVGYRMEIAGEFERLGCRSAQRTARMGKRKFHHSYSSAEGTTFRAHTNEFLGYVRIDSITPVGAESVYDIEVDGWHNFVAEGLIVHNSEMVYHSIQENLTKQGVIFLSSDDGLRQYPDLFKEHFGTVIPIQDNKFAAVNSAVWSGGSFVYVPKGVKVEMPLQAYFRLNSESVGQFERTLIIVDEGAQVHYVEGCTAPTYSRDSFHSGVIEIVVKKGARCRYTTIQNWSANVYNLVTQRATVAEDATMEWTDANLGSKLTMKYPSCYLMGKGAKGEILSMAFAGTGQHQDTGGKVVHVAPYTRSKITSKSISLGSGRASYRGLLKVYKGAEGAQSHVQCDALLLNEESRTDTYPYIEIDEDRVTIGHEATVSKIGDEQLFYLMSRGLDEVSARSMVVSGFIEPMVKELPMEYAVEMNRLIQLQMEGSVG
jgi:Fe-S cluster assembly protein SufB